MEQCWHLAEILWLTESPLVVPDLLQWCRAIRPPSDHLPVDAQVVEVSPALFLCLFLLLSFCLSD